MRKHQIENAAFEVATQVRAVEDSIESTLAELAELQARIVHARPVTRAPFTSIQGVFDHVAAVTGSLVSARDSIGKCHVALAEAKQSIPGLRTVGFGDEGDCPKTAVADLRIVA